MLGDGFGLEEWRDRVSAWDNTNFELL